MRVGIIAEGKTDQAVIENILRGVFGIDSESIQHIRPSDGTDETDLQQQKLNQYANSALVRKDCVERFKIRDFFASPIDEGERLLVIHVDTDEIGRTDAVLTAVRPPKDSRATPASKKSKKKTSNAAHSPAEATTAPYADTLRNSVIAEIDGWLEGEYKDQLRYAIAIEETEAWVLALHIKEDTSELRDPKKALEKFLNEPNRHSKQDRKRLFGLEAFARFDELSKGFRRQKTLLDAANRNRSLELFVASLSLPILSPLTDDY